MVQAELALLTDLDNKAQEMNYQETWYLSL